MTEQPGASTPAQTEIVGRIPSLDELLSGESVRDQFTVEAFEDAAGGVYLHRVGENTIWFLGPVMPDMEGRFAEDAQGWRDEQWEPDESNGQEPCDGEMSGLQLIATWSSRGGVEPERSQTGDLVAGAGGQAYLGLDDSE
jgi:hypothetical protein